VSTPAVSVVVSTYERPERLALLLDGLRRQTIAPSRFEIVVVDDGSGPETEALLRAAQARGDLPLRIARHASNQGQSAGRNTGWRLAQAPLVAFTDDDCVPTPGWLAALLAAAAEHPGTIVQGPTLPEPDELKRGLILARTVRSIELGPQYETCNIAYPRALLSDLGGFDVRWAVGEDTDLAWRAIAAGAGAVAAPEALVHHAVDRPGLRAMLRDAARWSEAAHVFAAHPQARVMLHRRLFWNPWHELLIRSVLSIWAPRWLRAIVLARHAQALYARTRELGGGAGDIPALLLYDTVQTGAMMRAAVRHRTPLL
jgi:glycosyltransferase involved in cell wall biosynthesis